MTTEYILRNVEDGETEWLFELNKQSYHDVVVRQFGSWDETFQRDWFDKKWEQGRPAKVVSIGNEPVGVVVLERTDTHDWLDEILIKSEHRGKGIGTSLMKELIADARGRNHPLRLRVLHENQRAMHFYESLGFFVLKSLENHYLMEIH